MTVRRAQNELTNENADDCQDKDDISRVVTLKEIEDAGYVLSPNRYVQYHKEEQESYEDVHARFVAACQEVREAEQAFNQLMVRSALQ